MTLSFCVGLPDMRKTCDDDTKYNQFHSTEYGVATAYSGRAENRSPPPLLRGSDQILKEPFAALALVIKHFLVIPSVFHLWKDVLRFNTRTGVLIKHSCLRKKLPPPSPSPFTALKRFEGVH